MPIWCHQLLSLGAALAGFAAGGALLFFIIALVWPSNAAEGDGGKFSPVWVLPLIALPFAGIHLGGRLMDFCPARCPQCRGRAYIVGHRPVWYRCRDCGAEKRLSVSVAWGRR